jgi:hypothetical protein
MSSRLQSKKLNINIYKSVMLPIVFYWYGIWEEFRLIVFLRTNTLFVYSPWKTFAASHMGGFLNYVDIWWVSFDEWSSSRKISEANSGGNIST